MKKKKSVTKKSPVKAAFATSLLVSMAFFSLLTALNLDQISCYFGINPCVTGSPRNPAQRNWNNPGAVDNSAATQPFTDYIADTIFIGDSRTNGLKGYRYVKPENVYAVDGLNHQDARYDRFINLGTGRLLTITEAVAITQPARMIVSFGINGISFMGEQTFMNEYAAFIDELKAASPNSLIAIQSILPVSHNYELNRPQITNEKIDLYNSLLKELAQQKDCRFWDTSSLFKDGYNCLSYEYDCGDGLHFNTRAYEALLIYLDQHRIL
ncbi:MAG: GDSL-type esterase/lipase family protein [Oscillospiraceae bacterium]|jgi:lysophospholipase L1-like esterase|nr:GDSL-type esterase/lipase family protein [Oscillospiraceae bacterium]